MVFKMNICNNKSTDVDNLKLDRRFMWTVPDFCRHIPHTDWRRGWHYFPDKYHREPWPPQGCGRGRIPPHRGSSRRTGLSLLTQSGDPLPCTWQLLQYWQPGSCHPPAPGQCSDLTQITIDYNDHTINTSPVGLLETLSTLRFTVTPSRDNIDISSGKFGTVWLFV